MKAYLHYLFLFCLLSPIPIHAQSLSDAAYDIGDPSVADYYVDPVGGKDSNPGTSQSKAFRTLTQAWNTIPQNQTLTTGFRINILPGTLAESEIPNYFEARYGTSQAPIIIQAAEGAGTAVLLGDLNIFDTRYLYLINLVIRPGGDTLHCEKCDHLLIRGGEYDGGARAAHETIKINQSQNVYIEQANIHGADDNAIDFVSVQNAHVIYNHIHDSQDWCMYNKGGSAYIRVEGNEIYNCGTGGYTAGQGTGIEFMTSPWIHYEAYDIKVVNNVIHDTEGAGLGINGGYNIVAAFNTLYRVGSRSHTIEVVYGSHSCDGSTSTCAARLAAGGWGTTAGAGQDEPIPDKNVFIYNNVVYNPPGFSGPTQVFAIYGPRTPHNGSNIPSPAVTDDGLSIRGNVVWNRPGETRVGVEDDDQGCRPSNPTCTLSQLSSDNTINVIEPALQAPQLGDFRPVDGGNLFSAATYPVPNFLGGDRQQTPLAPEGDLTNTTLRDRGVASRGASSPPGAYASSTSALDPGDSNGGGNGDNGGSGGGGTNTPPKISKAQCTPKSVRKGKTISCTVTAKDDGSIASVVVQVGTQTPKRLSGKPYKGKVKMSKKGKLKVVVMASDNSGQVSSKSLGKFTIN